MVKERIEVEAGADGEDAVVDFSTAFGNISSFLTQVSTGHFGPDDVISWGMRGVPQ